MSRDQESGRRSSEADSTNILCSTRSAEKKMVTREEAAVEIVKPRTDKREYRRVVLKNSLEVLLISDPDTDKCAASMNVCVGSFCDPDDLEGLAHFLEHMLFYASDKYPIEDSFSKYVTEHGGCTNAYTSSEDTNYHFSINPDCFEEGLDRFAQFFVKPLMSPDATMRELNAVNAENQKNLLSDGHRMYQLQKHLTEKGHPYHKFSTGNLETLNFRPKERGIDIRTELIKFYEKHYSSNLMNLAVYGKKGLDEIQGLVKSKFQDVPNTGRSPFRFPGQPCTTEHLQILVKAVPIQQRHKLRIVWPITPSINYYKEAPTNYLGHLIGHEGQGSLFYILKKLGWATSLSAGEDGSSCEFSFFCVSIYLTDAGQDNVEGILGLLFRYIRLLQQSGVCKWIFDEISAISEIGFHYQDKISELSCVIGLSSNMKFYPPHDWLVGSYLPSVFNSKTIELVLNELNSNSIRIFWESKRFEGRTDMVEPWYGTEYSVEKISTSMIQNWMESAPNENLHLPAPNVFIPTDLSLKNASKKMKFPTLLRESPYSSLWYKPDTLFSTPKASVTIKYHCPHSCNSPETEVLRYIFTLLLEDYLNEYTYDADLAGLSYGIGFTSSGFQVTVDGYNHKLKVLLERVIEAIVTFQVKPDRFSVNKELATKNYQNSKYDQPYEQATYYCSLILRDQLWPWMDELEILPHLEASDLDKYVPRMLSRTFLECYIAGNLDPSEADSMIQHVESLFFKGSSPISRAMLPSQHFVNRVVNLKKGIHNIYLVEGLNPGDENSALVHYIQVHQDDLVLNVKLQLLALIGRQHAFHQLRSVEQLGYVVSLSLRHDYGIRGLEFVIQSTVKDPKHIETRIEAFLKMFETKLNEMSKDEFKRLVDTLIDMKLEKFKNFWEETGFYYREIYSGTLKFDRREQEAEALRQLSQQELVDFFNEYVKVGAPRKKTLSVRVYGSSHLSEYKADKSQPLPSNSIFIDDIFCFRRSRPLYGSLKGRVNPTKFEEFVSTESITAANKKRCSLANPSIERFSSKF